MLLCKIYGRTFKAIIQPLQKVQNSSLRAFQIKDHYYPINEMLTEFKILNVADKIECKIQKRIHSILYSPNLISKPLHSLGRPKRSFDKYQEYSKGRIPLEYPWYGRTFTFCYRYLSKLKESYSLAVFDTYFED